jgi:hypothetical protein
MFSRPGCDGCKRAAFPTGLRRWQNGRGGGFGVHPAL